MTAAAAIAATLLAGCWWGGDGQAAPAPTPAPATAPAPAPDRLGARLAEAFRIDISEVEVGYDYWPSQSRLRGSAVLRFEMRPGQTRPLFHFNPLRGSTPPEHELLRTLTLDGERLDPTDRDDLRRVRPHTAAELALEVQRDLSPAAAHTLRMSWAIPYQDPGRYPGWFYTNFDDTVGPRNETETWWPTISSPEEFARHRLRFRVHSDRRYTMLGSGVVRRRDPTGVQAWDVDTLRPVASHTVLLAAVPSGQVRTTRFDVGGVEVWIVSDRSPQVMRRARASTRTTMTRLVDDLGPFPMPSMQILLTGWGSGMEYYGATRTGIGSLRHELAHMYFGAATVNRTWRDTWIDESVVVWWERQDSDRRLHRPFSSDIAGGLTVVEPRFDTAAYGAGALILGEVASGLGGKQQMVEFLADLHRRRAFVPFTTRDLIDDVVAAQDAVVRADLERWLFAGR